MPLDEEVNKLREFETIEPTTKPDLELKTGSLVKRVGIIEKAIPYTYMGGIKSIIEFLLVCEVTKKFQITAAFPNSSNGTVELEKFRRFLSDASEKGQEIEVIYVYRTDISSSRRVLKMVRLYPDSGGVFLKSEKPNGYLRYIEIDRSSYKN